MRKLLLPLAVGIATFAMAAPALSAVTLVPVNGSNLDTFIKASTTNTVTNATIVFGSTLNSGASADVTFTANTNVNITGGAGFASISDADRTKNFTQLIVNPEPDFTALQFSVALEDAGFVFIEYMLSGTNVFSSILTGENPFDQAQKTNQDYQITATGGDVLSAIRITTCTVASGCTSGGTGTGTGIFLEKQNSITLAGVTPPVPEPGTWAMMLIGFGAVGVGLRRRKRTVLQAV